MKKNCQGYFCSQPFEHTVIDQNGDVFMCCQTWLPVSLGNLVKNDWDEIWNGRVAQTIRKSIHEGTFDFCDHLNCPYLQGQPGRLKKRDAVNPEFREIVEKRLTVLDRGPASATAGYDSTCNLACPSCRCGYIVLKGEEMSFAEKLHEKVWSGPLADAEFLIFPGMGDPFSSRLYRQTLRDFDALNHPHLKLCLITNGLLLTPAMWESIRSCHSAIMSINVSVNAASAATFAINQKGGRWEKLLENMAFLASLRRAGTLESFNTSFYVLDNNFREMRQFVDLAREWGVDELCFARMANWGTMSDEAFHRCAVHLPEHPDHAELLEILKDPCFREPFVNMGNMSSLMPGAAALTPVAQLAASEPLTLAACAETLQLTDPERKEIEAVLNALKERFADIIATPPAGGAPPPITMLSGDFNGEAQAAFFRHLSVSRLHTTGRTYLEHIVESERHAQQQIGTILGLGLAQALKCLCPNGLLDIDTGYQPVEARMAGTLESDTAPEPDAGLTLERLAAAIGLDGEQRRLLEEAVQSVKLGVRDVYFAPAEGGISPGEYLVQLARAQKPEAVQLFLDYLEQQKEARSGRPYKALVAEMEAAVRERLAAALPPQQREALHQLNIPFSAVAGHDPFNEEVERRLKHGDAPVEAPSPAPRDFEGWARELRLDPAQRTALLNALRALRDEAVDLYSRRGAAGEIAPIALLARELARRNARASQEFLRHAARVIEPETGLAYVQAIKAAEQRARTVIAGMLNQAQLRAFAPALAGSLLDIDIGYDPFGAALAHAIRETGTITKTA